MPEQMDITLCTDDSEQKCQIFIWTNKNTLITINDQNWLYSSVIISLLMVAWAEITGLKRQWDSCLYDMSALYTTGDDTDWCG